MDFGLPQNYIKNKALGKSNFTKGLESKVRERFDKAVKSITLKAQIEGEAIPSRIDSRVNAQAVMFVEARVKNIKDASAVASVIQNAAKPLVAVEIIDDSDDAVLNFALKRLNENDQTQVVIDDGITSPKYNTALKSVFKDEALQQLGYGAITNKNDKYAYYLELAVKCYLLSNPKLYDGISDLLSSKIWYNESKVKAMFEMLKTIEAKKREVARAEEITEQMQLNTEIKELIKEVKQYE